MNKNQFSTIPRLCKQMSDISQSSKWNATAAYAPASFLSLPGELRNRIYELVLLHQEPIGPWVVYNGQKFTSGLLRVNKAVHGEASSVFYGQNRFDFTDVAPEQVAWFLEQIGRRSAGYIRHTFIDFPKFLYLDPGDVTLEKGSASILANIQSACPKLRTLTTSLYSTNAMELRIDNLDHPKVAAEAFNLIDTRFRAISALQEIILEVYEDGPSDYIRGMMKSHGWTISTTEYVEEEDRGLSDFDDDDYGYGDDGDDYDDYDIDDDSDFWRRAGD